MPFFLFAFFLMMVAYAILINYYYRAWNQLNGFTADVQTASVYISVIIPVRNEEKNIIPLMESLHRQTYPRHLFEIIIIDDHSDDATPAMLEDLRYHDLQVRTIKLEANSSYTGPVISHKKKAIETGIAAARGTLIVTTDADCLFQTNWLAAIAAFYESTGAKFIAAPVRMTGKPGLLSVFQSLDFLTLQGITGASVYKRFHSMCNGANLAYEKAVFYEVKGFDKIDNIPTGDDMLLMHKIYKQYPGKVFYLKSKEAIVTTETAVSWKAFFHQRIRWASKADRYDDKRIFWVLLLVYLVNVSFLVLGIASFRNNIWLFFLLILLFAKILIEFPFVHTVAIFFGQQRLMKYFPFLQPLHILYTIIAGWLGKFGSYEWKGRRIVR